MKMRISIIHLGRYKIDMLDDDNQIVRGYDCGLAGLMVALNNWIFVPEHIAYQGDQRKSSDELGQTVIDDMKANPDKYLPHPNTFKVLTMKDRPELTALIQKSVDAFNAMPLKERKAMRAAQAKSWVIGEFMLEHPEATREYAEGIYDSVCR